MSILTEVPTDEVKTAFKTLESFNELLMDRAFKYLEIRNPNSRLTHIPGSNVIYSKLYRVRVTNLEGVLFQAEDRVEFEVETLHSPDVPVKTFKISRDYALTNDVALYLQSGGVMD